MARLVGRLDGNRRSVRRRRGGVAIVAVALRARGLAALRVSRGALDARWIPQPSLCPAPANTDDEGLATPPLATVRWKRRGTSEIAQKPKTPPSFHEKPEAVPRNVGNFNGRNGLCKLRGSHPRAP